MTGFRFQDPYWLLLFLPFLWLIVRRMKARSHNVLVFSHTTVLHDLPKTFASRIKPFVIWFIYIGLALLIIALARPQQGREGFRIRSEGIAIAMCLDRSGSMQAMDFFLDRKRVDRLEVVKKVFRDFVLGGKELPGRPNDMISLVAFGGYVDACCPLTLDHETLAQMLSMVQTPQPLTGKDGRIIYSAVLEEEAATAIGDALLCSIDRLNKSNSRSKVIILLSDGMQNAGVITAEEATKIAKEFGIRVYTIGIGTSEPVPFPVYTVDGEKGYSNQILELDSKTLKGIAEETGGKYFHVDETNALRKVCTEIDKMEKTTHDDRIFTQYTEWYRWFLGPGLGFLLIGAVLMLTRFRRIP